MHSNKKQCTQSSNKISHNKNTCQCINRIFIIEQELKKINFKIDMISRSLQIPNQSKEAMKYPQSQKKTGSQSKNMMKRHNNISLNENISYDSLQRNYYTQKQIQNISHQGTDGYSYHHENQADSFLLEDLELTQWSNRQKLQHKNKIPFIGHQILSMNKKICHIQEEIVILPKLKSNVSMLTKIIQYLQEKTEKIIEQFHDKTESKQKKLLDKLQYNRILKKQHNVSLDSLRLSDDSMMKELPRFGKNQIERIQID